jgi:hypothetical protein
MTTLPPAFSNSAARAMLPGSGAWALAANAAVGLVARGRLVVFQGLLLHVCGNGDMGHGALRQCGPRGERHGLAHMLGAVDRGRIGRHVLKHAGVVDILLGVGGDQVVVRQSGDREHRRPVELGVVEAGQQVGPAWAGGRQANAQLTRPLGVGAGHEGRRFLVARLDEPDSVLPGPKRLHDPVDAVSGQTEDHLHPPLDERLDQDVGCGLRHDGLPGNQVRS